MRTGWTQGRALLERAVEEGADPEAAASLAGTWKGVDDDRARALYLRAHELDPSHPYALGNLLEYEIEAAGDLSPVTARRARDRRRGGTVRATGRRPARTSRGPGTTWPSSGCSSEMPTAPSPGTRRRSVGASRRSRSPRRSASLDRLAARAEDLAGLEEARRLLRLGEAAGSAPSGDDPVLRALATPGAWPLAPPVAILAGGSSDAVDELVRGYADVFRDAFAGWPGTIVSGGTRQGVSEIAGDLGAAGARVVGYLPASVPAGVAVDDDPRRYAELRRSDGKDFGAREPIRYWADVLTSGIDPRTVRVDRVGRRTDLRVRVPARARAGCEGGSDPWERRRRRASSSRTRRGRRRDGWKSCEPEPDAIRAFLGHA